MKPDMKLGLQTHLSMTPQLRQAIRLLQLSALDLRLEIQTFVESNPLLELEEVDISADPYGEEDYDGYQTSSPYSDHDFHQQALNQHIAPESLQDYLRTQMRLQHLHQIDHLIATALIDALNDDGYLTMAVDEILTSLPKSAEISHERIEKVLYMLQKCDPIGIAARSLGECLQIQAQYYWPNDPDATLLTKIIQHHLSVITPHHHEKLAKKLKISLTTLQTLVKKIMTLDPKPGLRVGAFKASYVIPDAFVRRRNHQWHITLNTHYMPHLQLHTKYTEIAQKSHTPYFRECMQEARWLIKSLDHRNSTLYKVLYCLVEIQSEYLLHGEKYMRPLILQDIAEMVNLHPSTISRITANKYIDTPQGMLPLKKFFCSELETSDGNACASTAIRALIRQWITTEDRTHPWTDSHLVQVLAKEGIMIARRTIAKYRDLLDIPPSHLRRR